MVKAAEPTVSQLPTDEGCGYREWDGQLPGASLGGKLIMPYKDPKKRMEKNREYVREWRRRRLFSDSEYLRRESDRHRRNRRMRMAANPASRERELERRRERSRNRYATDPGFRELERERKRNTFRARYAVELAYREDKQQSVAASRARGRLRKLGVLK